MNVVNNFGSVQSSLGQLLDGSTEQFWVDAEKDDDSQFLYRYQGEEPHIFHLPPGTENQQGDCLTYSSVDGGLITRVRETGSANKSMYFEFSKSFFGANFNLNYGKY